MAAWDMWDSVPKVLLKLLSQPQALSPKAFPAFPSWTCCSLHPLGSATVQGRPWPWNCSQGFPGPHWGPGSPRTELLPWHLTEGPARPSTAPNAFHWPDAQSDTTLSNGITAFFQDPQSN